MPSISDLDTNAALTAVENKIPNFSNPVKQKLWWQNIRH